MPRVPRSLSVRPNYAVHKVWRGHNREWNLNTNEQKLRYLELLNEDLESEKYLQGSVLNALTLMSGHTHEILKILFQKLFSDHMRRHHSRYGAWFNRQEGRCGKVAQDRPHTTLIENDSHEMRATFYIHANPVRANMVRDASTYRWSTHRLYAFGNREPWMRNIVLPDWYLGLGSNPAQRQRRYRRLFASYLKEFGLVKQGFLKRRFFGSDSWRDRLETEVSAWRKGHSAPS